MYLRSRLLYVVLGLFIVAYTLPAFAEPDQGLSQEEDRVTSKIIIFIIDGLQNETLQKTSVPNINGIANAGIRISKVTSVFPDTPQATITSVITGILPEKHNFIQPGDEFKAKTILQAMEEKKINTSFFGVEGDLKKLMAAGSYNSVGSFKNNDEAVMSNVLNQWTKGQSYLNVIVLPELRSVLSKHGVNSNDYKMAVTKTDTQVGRLLRKLHEEKTFENSMIIITGTLGSPPLVIKGLPFKENVQLPPVSICDIAPTIGYLNGVNLEEADGLVIWNALKNTPNQSEEYLLGLRVKDLSSENSHLLEEMNRLQEEKELVKKQQEIIAKEKDDIQRQIEVRDQNIVNLEKRIDIYHLITLAVAGLVVLSYAVLYRVLRKRFLMF